jgi:type I restriction enzyme S subunit
LEDWKKACEQAKTKGNKKPAKPKKPKELLPLTEKELAELPELPEGWSWKKFGEVCERIFDGTHFSPQNFTEGDYKYITAKNIKESRIDLDNITYVSKDVHDEIYSKADVKNNDVLYIKDGVKTGIAAVNCLEEEFSLLSSVGVFRTNQNYISSRYLCHYLNSPITRNRMLSNIAGVAITRLTLVKLNHSYFAFAPKDEQIQIVQEIDSRLSVCDKIEQTAEDSLKKAEALWQSILKKAFAGELTKDWRKKHPELITRENSAEKLLEKIKMEKALGAGRKKPRSRKTKKK